MSFLKDLPVVGSLFGGDSSGGLLGLGLNMSGLPQLMLEGLLIFLAFELLLKLIDKV